MCAELALHQHHLNSLLARGTKISVWIRFVPLETVRVLLHCLVLDEEWHTT